MLNVYNIAKSNYVNGNGNRYVIWLQGCNLGCKHCWNKQTWSFNENRIISINEIFQDIQNQKNLDGLTFTGGEPLLQFEGVFNLAKIIKSETNLSVQIFSGLTYKEIKYSQKSQILKYADVLVLNRFEPSKVNNGQEVVLLNKENWVFDNTSVEAEIDENGIIHLTGYPTDALIDSFQ